MATKYWRYTVKGEHGAADAHAMLGPVSPHGLIVRVHSQGGETHIYVAADRAPEIAGKKAEGLGMAVEVAEEEVMKIR